MRRALRNPQLVAGGVIVLAILLVALFHPFLAPYGVEQMDMANRLSGPSARHWLGTDNFGRDLWTRLSYGAAISMSIAMASVLIAGTVGTTIGLISGYAGGWLDLALSRLVDLFLAFPPLILALALIAVLGPGPVNVTIAISAAFWTQYARVVRAITLAERERDYVLAAEAVGASLGRILGRHILPNAAGPILVLATLVVGTAIVTESGLSFLGLGVQPPTPTWGWTLSYGLRFLRSDPWMSTLAGLTIMLTVLGFNLLGDGLRDHLDPRGVIRRARKNPVS